MKKLDKKLSLNRETIATLSPELLGAINGGQSVGTITPHTTTITTTTPRPPTITTTTRPPVTINICPSRVVCSVGGNGQGQG